MRFVHLIVVVALVCAAAYVYKIKFDATVQAERVAKLRTEIRREHESLAALKAEWSQLDNPARIQGLASRHLSLVPMNATQVESLERLPDRPPPAIAPASADPIGAMIGDDYPTGSVVPAASASAPLAPAR